MSRLAALLEKEARHHFGVAVALTLFLPLSFLLVAAGHALNPSNITNLAIHQSMLWVFLPLTALVVGHRLIVVEYQRRTQLFIEALPVRRAEMVGVKWVLGFVALETVAVASLIASAAIASSTEPIDARFFGIMAARTVATVACLWSLCFAMGFLGRFRVPLYIALGLVLVAVDRLTSFEIGRFGPFALVGEPLVLDRVAVPTEELLVTVAVTVALTGAGFGLALIQEGSLAESLARRMTLKEKSVAGGLIVAALIALSAFEDLAEPAPFELDDEAVLRAEDGGIEVFYVEGDARADAEELLELLVGDLARLREALDLDPSDVPKVRVVLRESLDARTFEPVRLPRRDGVLVRASFRRWSGDAAPYRRDFRAFLLRRVIVALTDERAEYEPRAWVLDGFPRWLLDRTMDDGACRGGAPTCLPLLRAAWAAGDPAPSLGRWLRVRERHGAEVAEALAFSALLHLERSRGRGAVEGLGRALLARRAPRDMRAVIHELRHPLREVFEARTGVAFEPFVTSWRAWLREQRERPEVARALEAVPAPEAALDVGAGDDGVPRVVASVRLPAPATAPLPVALLHRDVGPFDRPLERYELLREEMVLAAGRRDASIELIGRYGRGTRAFFAVEIDSTALGCPLRLVSRRGGIP